MTVAFIAACFLFAGFLVAGILARTKAHLVVLGIVLSSGLFFVTFGIAYWAHLITLSE